MYGCRMGSDHQLRWLLAALVFLIAACGDDTTGVTSPPQTTRPATTTGSPTTSSGSTSAPAPPAECSGFLECADDVPPGVAGAITVLTPGPPCLPTDTIGVVPESPVQGDVIFICVPSSVTRDAPYRVVLEGPAGTVFDETRDTPEGISAVQWVAFPNRAPTGRYEVTVVQDASSTQSKVAFDLSEATSPRLLVEEAAESSLTVWLSGVAPSSDVAVDFYVLADGECTYQGSETIPAGSLGVGFMNFDTSATPPGSYFVFPRTVESRFCFFEKPTFVVS